MKYLFHLVVACLVLVGCTEKPIKNTTAIVNVNLFDGDTLLLNVNVLFADGVVVKISQDAVVAETLIDGEGKTIIPPLMNAHVHVWKAKELKDAASKGVLAVFDMHTSDNAAAKLRAHRTKNDHAFYYAAGPGATVKGGHGTQYRIVVPMIGDKLTPEQFVIDRLEKGADYIKLLREPRMPTINFQQTDAVIKTTHQHDKLCVSHISNLKDAVMLAKQEVDGLVHIWIDKVASDEQLDTLRNAGLFIVPTLMVNERLLELLNSRGQSASYISYGEVLREVKRAHKLGISILAGTDSPNFGFNANTDLLSEMESLRFAGLSNMDILRSGTSNVYKAFRLKEFGPLKEGCSASFILLDGNPIEDLAALRRMEYVWRNGELVGGSVKELVVR